MDWKERSASAEPPSGESVPVQLEDDGAVGDGEAQQADPPQQDAAEHAGMEVEDEHLRQHTHVVKAGVKETRWLPRG